MKPSYFRTPRTLSECQWTTGYPNVRRQAADITLAILIGIFLALALVIWWST